MNTEYYSVYHVPVDTVDTSCTYENDLEWLEIDWPGGKAEGGGAAVSALF